MEVNLNARKDIEVRFSTKQLPFEYKLLEYRLIVNKELYDEKVIDLRTYNEMENSIMGRLRKIRNEYLLAEKDDLTKSDYGATIQAS